MIEECYNDQGASVDVATLLTEQLEEINELDYESRKKFLGRVNMIYDMIRNEVLELNLNNLYIKASTKGLSQTTQTQVEKFNNSIFDMVNKLLFEKDPQKKELMINAFALEFVKTENMIRNRTTSSLRN